MIWKITAFYGLIFVSSLFVVVICRAAPSGSLHPAIWNHDDKVSGGSSLELHDHSDKKQGISASESNKSSELGRSVRGQHSSRIYRVHAADVAIAPAYENTVNPFLSHMEQGWKLKPVRHRYMRKKLMQSQQRQKMTSMDSYADELFGPLPVDPEKSHFVDSGEAGETEVEENRAFGHEEKDLSDLFHVLFSSDY